MLTSRTVFHYKYMNNNQHVYYVGRKLGDSFKHNVYFSEPFYIKERKEVRNVLKGYESEEHAYKTLILLDNGECDVYNTQLKELKYVASFLSMPLIVEMESYCELDDLSEHTNIYYFFNTKRNHGHFGSD